jgi:hypothetical protein
MICKSIGVIHSLLRTAAGSPIQPRTALAASSDACIGAKAIKANVQGIAAEKLRETLQIVRFALATRVIGDAELVFDAMLKA